ncbi:GATA transcription factor 26-like isoform X1 [Triticum dicoccoides]|uniref:GATA transcription factor 26-like isoform X1 n=1 Tax=Triticum dicoccoides TaxID=85692 RepID=UPI000E7974E6|nr:GATA transcription factor 26-like isoform X1 [Triticum dicoccoides]
MAKKEGPCGHCGVTSTPLWRNGPPDKPVLCNACGSRWRIRGTLVNYTPAHRREDTGASEARPDKLKLKGQKQPKKRPNRSIVKDEPWSDQNFWKMGNADTSNRSGSGSAVSYSESCAPYGSVDAREMAGSAQSHAWDSLVPSRKRSCVTRPKPSPVEELVEELNSILHEEKLYCLSAGSTEEDLLYHNETPVGSFEIGYGSVLLRHPNSKSAEEESEANSVPADSKSYITSESYSGSASFIAHSEIKGASNSNAASEKLKWSPMETHDSARRDELHYSNQHILESADSALVSVALEDKEVGGLTKSSMRSLKRPYESQPQSFTDAEVRAGTMRIASSRSGAMASSCQLRSSFLPKSGNATRASLNLFMLAPDKLSSMMNPSDKDSDQDSLLLEVPRNAPHPEAELLLCCPPPSQLSSVTVTAASPPSNHSPGSASDQLRNRHQW